MEFNKMTETLYVLYKNSGCHSGRALRKALTEVYKGTVLGGYPSRFEKMLAKNGDPGFIVNLGTTEDFDTKSTILNGREMVRACANKKSARQAFLEQGVPAPKLFLRGRDVPESDLPVVGRTSYHKKGKGFWFCKTLSQVQKAVDKGATHFLSFIPNTREYRVHTFVKAKAFGKEKRGPDSYVSVKLSEKVWQGDQKPDPNEPQKNHAFGWTFLGHQNRREEELDVVRYAAKQAIAALGVDFGAVDVMYKVRTKQPFVLEVNSTPSLSDATADTCEVYAKRILKTLGKLKEE